MDVRWDPGSTFLHLSIERLIGRGGFARVYLATDNVIGRRVALKVLAPPVAGDVDSDTGDEPPDVVAEARLIGQLNHPHVVTLYGAHEIPGGGWALEMEYMDGGSLADLLAAEHPPTPARCSEIATEIARGLASAHAAGIVHGDVKPGNVLLDAAGLVKLADFGLGRLLRDPGLATSTRADLQGTPRYMAPEVLMGRRAGMAADVWSFGVLLQHLLAGRAPFEESVWFATFHAILNHPAPPLPAHVPPGLTRLAQQCLAKRPEQRPTDMRVVLAALSGGGPATTAAAVITPPPTRARPEPVGRAAELETVARIVERVRDGEGVTLVVSGEAGIGKTTLMHEARTRSSADGFLWFEIGLTRTSGFLRPLLESLRQSASGAALHGIGAFESRSQLAFAIERHLLDLALHTPVGVLIEDAHDADPDERRLAADLARRLETGPVLFAVTWRESAAQGLDELTERSTVEHLRLGGLAREQVLSLLEADLDDGARIEAEVAQRIVSGAEGNPLFALELLRHFRDEGAVTLRDGTLGRGPAWERSHLPARVRDVLARRLTGCTQADRELLEVAAVDGIAFDGEAVAAVLEQPVLAVLRRLQTAYRERRLLQATESGYRFAHTLIQDLLYEELAPELRRRLHQRLAQHLADRPGPPVDPERLGTHWERAGDRERARPHLLDAAVAAEGRQELQRTIALCARAGFTPNSIDADAAREHVEALISLANCLGDTGRSDDAATVFEALIAAAATDEQRLRLQVRRARLLFASKGRDSVDTAAMRRATETLPPCRELAIAHYNLGWIAKNAGQIEEAETSFREAARVYVEIGHAAGHSDALAQLATIARITGRPDDAVRLYDDAAAISERIGRRTNAAICAFNRSLVAFAVGNLSGLPAAMAETIRIFELEGSTGHAGHACVILARIHFALGDLPAARNALSEGRAHLEQAGLLSGLGDADLTEADLCYATGDFATARSHAEAAAEAAQTRGNEFLELSAIAISALCHCHKAGHGLAVAAARDCVVRLADHDNIETRSTIVIRLAEGLLWGLPATAFAGLKSVALNEDASIVLAGCRRESAAAMHEAADYLEGPTTSDRRAVLRVLGAWLRALAKNENTERVQKLAASLGLTCYERAVSS